MTSAWQVALLLVCSLLLGTSVLGCGGSGEERGEGSPADPSNQPRIEPLNVEGTLGVVLGAPDPNVPDPATQRVIQAVAGLDHVCALLQEGSVWCWGDPGNGFGANSTWPAQPTVIVARWRGQELPPLRELVVPDVTDGPSDFLSQRRSTCGRDDENRWWCWGQHASLPNQDRIDMVTAVWATEGIGELVRPGQPAPSELVARLDLGAGLADLTPSQGPVMSLRADIRCAITREGELWCWSNAPDATAAPTHVADFPAGTKLSGACALTPEGSAHCYLPFPEGKPCPLGLRSMSAVGTRGCGERDDGTWACFGRPIGAPVIELPGLVDLPVTHCERGW